MELPKVYYSLTKNYLSTKDRNFDFGLAMVQNLM